MPEPAVVEVCRVVGVHVPRVGYRWRGSLLVETRRYGRVVLLMSGAVAQWFSPGGC